MKKNLIRRKTVSIILACMVSVGVLSGCNNERPDTSSSESLDNNISSQTTTDQSASTGGDEVLDGIIIQDGLAWNTNTNQYVIEDAVLSGSVPLKLWLDNEEYGLFVKERFEAMYPGVVIEFQMVGSVDSADMMALAGESGSGADVYLIPHDHIGNTHNRNLIGPMGLYEDEIRERFNETGVGIVNIDGQLWGVPYLTESIALFYNQTLLQQLADDGLIESATPAADFNDILALSEVYDNPAQNKYSIRWEPGNAYMSHFFLTAFGYELFGPDGADPNSPGFDSQDVVDGLEYFASMRQAWNVLANDANWESTTIEFAKGETPYMIMGPWGIEDVQKGADEHGFQFSVMPLPKVDGKQPYTFSGSQLIVVSPYSPYPAASRVLAMFIGSDEILEYTYSVMGKVPALKSQYADNISGLKDDERIQAIMAQAAFSKPMPAIKEISYFWDPAGAMYQSVWDRTATPADAAAKAYSDYMALLQAAQ